MGQRGPKIGCGCRNDGRVRDLRFLLVLAGASIRGAAGLSAIPMSIDSSTVKKDGVPLGIKDLFCTEGVQTTAGSHILEGFKPQYESTVTQKLWDAGAGCWASSTSTSSRWARPTRPAIRQCDQPWRARAATDLVPGGSSGGSRRRFGAARPAATGTDTGGSIRQPAAFTGIVGIKPTYGRCSRWGIVAFASSLDQAGPMARTCATRDHAGSDGRLRRRRIRPRSICRCRNSKRPLRRS
jgi:hypothetical protein